MRPLPPDLLLRVLTRIHGRQELSDSIHTKVLQKGPAAPVKGEAGSFFRTEGSVDRSMLALLEQSGLPRDSISESLIRFFRFFMLPMQPSTLRSFHQASLRSEKKDAAALALAAAASKGTRLSSEALHEYAAAIDPSADRDTGSDRDNKDKKEDTEEIMKRIKASLGKKTGVHALLNRLPDRDGRRWIVIPFNFFHNNIEFKLSIRLLLNNTPTGNGSQVELMTIDVSTEARRWNFIVEDAGAKTALICVDPELDHPDLAEKELKKLLVPLTSTVRMLHEQELPFREYREPVPEPVREDI